MKLKQNYRLSSGFLLKLAAFCHWILISVNLHSVRLLCFQRFRPSAVDKRRLLRGCQGPVCHQRLHLQLKHSDAPLHRQALHGFDGHAIRRCALSSVAMATRELLASLERKQVFFFCCLFPPFFSPLGWLNAAKYLRALACWELVFMLWVFGWSFCREMKEVCLQEIKWLVFQD